MNWSSLIRQGAPFYINCRRLELVIFFLDTYISEILFHKTWNKFCLAISTDTFNLQVKPIG